MKEFYESYTFITAFVVFVALIYMVAGPKVTEAFLWLVLFGMIVTNADKFSRFVRGLKP